MRRDIEAELATVARATWLRSLTPAEREHFEERAAIHEFDGGLARDEAERRARDAVDAQRKERP